MPIENHPLYSEWSAALNQLVEAERRYYAALMERQFSESEIEAAARDLDAARERYRNIADKIEEYDPPTV